MKTIKADEYAVRAFPSSEKDRLIYKQGFVEGYTLALAEIRNEVLSSMAALEAVARLAGFETEKAWNRGHGEALAEVLRNTKELDK